MKRLLTSIFAGVVVFGLVAAFAATLTVTDGGIGAGSVAVGNCDADGVTIAYDHVWDGVTDNRYEISAVEVKGIDTTNCDTISVRFDSTDLATSAAVTAVDMSFTVTNVPATTVANVDVVLAKS